jgi:hypothetical protein
MNNKGGDWTNQLRVLAATGNEPDKINERIKAIPGVGVK